MHYAYEEGNYGCIQLLLDHTRTTVQLQQNKESNKLDTQIKLESETNKSNKMNVAKGQKRKTLDSRK